MISRGFFTGQIEGDTRNISSGFSLTARWMQLFRHRPHAPFRFNFSKLKVESALSLGPRPVSNFFDRKCQQLCTLYHTI